MSEVLFSHRQFGEDQTDKAALLVAGFTGKIHDLEGAAQALVKHGHNVFAYEFDPRVLADGDPALLPQVVSDITDDFLEQTTSYKTIQPCGVSMGAGIAWETQKRELESGLGRARPGIYAAAGADSADGVFGHNPLTLPLRKAFTANGHSHEEVKKLWTEIHTPPETGFSIALGGLDIIVRHHDIMRKIRGWREQGIPIEQKTLWHLGHTGTINWYVRNLDTLLEHS